MKYKATIILPCYNKEKYIKRSLESIISLSRFKEFEVILIDDCSSDNTVNIIEEYEKKYNNIKLFRFKKRSGSPSKPRNTGIKKSTGKYLIFMDPDDEIINDGYSTLLTKIEEYESDILIGTRIGVNEYGRKVWVDFIYKDGYINSNSYDIKLDLLNRPPFILKTIYKKSLIIDNNILFNEKITTSEDEGFDMKCLAHAKKITKINDIVYQYTAEAEGSVTTNVSLKIYQQTYDILKELDEAYSLLFDRETIMERFLNLYYRFYIKKIIFLKTTEDIEKACSLIYDAFEKYGFDNFDVLTKEEYKKQINDIKNRNLNEYINKCFIERLDSSNKAFENLDKEHKNLNKKYDILSKEKEMLEVKIEKLTNKNKKNKKILNRKIMKLAIRIMKILDKITGTIKRNKED